MPGTASAAREQPASCSDRAARERHLRPPADRRRHVPARTTFSTRLTSPRWRTRSSCALRSSTTSSRSSRSASPIISGSTARRGKVALRRAFAADLPPEILDRGKAGFGVPVARWFREELRDLAGDVLARRDGARAGPVPARGRRAAPAGAHGRSGRPRRADLVARDARAVAGALRGRRRTGMSRRTALLTVALAAARAASRRRRRRARAAAERPDGKERPLRADVRRTAARSASFPVSRRPTRSLSTRSS